MFVKIDKLYEDGKLKPGVYLRGDQDDDILFYINTTVREVSLATPGTNQGIYKHHVLIIKQVDGPNHTGQIDSFVDSHYKVKILDGMNDSR